MSITVTPVRFEHHREALGIGEIHSAPELDRRVGAAGLAAGGLRGRAARCRRSGRPVESADSVLVPWPFAPLVSRERAEVRVRVDR